MKKVGDMKLYSFEGPILTILTNDKSIFRTTHRKYLFLFNYLLNNN